MPVGWDWIGITLQSIANYQTLAYANEERYLVYKTFLVVNTG